MSARRTPARAFTLNISERELVRRVLSEYIASVLDCVGMEEVGLIGLEVVCSIACWNTASAFERIDISDMDDGDCWEMIRLFEPEATATLISLSLCILSPSDSTNEPRRFVGIVDRLEGGGLAIEMEISFTEDKEMAEDIGVMNEVATCSDKFMPGFIAAVESGFFANVAGVTGRGMKRLTT
jgi:hypothetical protein